MILVRKARVADKPGQIGTRLFGNPDDCFLQSRPKRGLLTPAEVRALALSELGLRTDSVVWDVGAGSGSVGLEAARIARDGTVHAIEMDSDDHHLIQENAQRFGVTNLRAVLGKAPEAWARRSRRYLRWRQWPRHFDARGRSLEAAQIRWPAGDSLQQYREPRRRACDAAGPFGRRLLLDGEHRPGHRADGSHPV